MKKDVKNTKKEVKVEKKDTKNNKENSNKKNTKKENIFKRILKYFNGVGKEVKRIRWTSGKELFKYSLATVVFVLFLGLYFYAIDWLVLLIRSLAK